MIVRTAAPGDAAALGQVRDASWRAAYGPLLPPDALDSLDGAAWGAQRIEQLRAGTLGVLVAEVDEVVRGYALFGPSRDEDTPGCGEVYAIYAHPDDWSTGLGRALLSAAVDTLGGPPVTLWVLAANARARRFYGIAGFVPDGATKPAELPGGVRLPEVRYRLSTIRRV